MKVLSADRSGPVSVLANVTPLLLVAHVCRPGVSVRCCVMKPRPEPLLPYYPGCCQGDWNPDQSHEGAGLTRVDNLETQNDMNYNEIRNKINVQSNIQILYI